MKRVISIVVALVATAGQASAAVECNEHGAVFSLDDGTVLYLGKNCDAAREGGGTGTWWNAASFLGARIDGEVYMITEETDCLPFCSI